MLRGMRPFLVFVALLIGLRAAAAGEFQASRCTPARDGEVACLDGRLCECRHDPGGTLTGRRAGMRWNCGALRPSCGSVPAEAGPQPAERAPPAFYPAPYVPPPMDWR
jgi:hypothetical protein